MADYERRYDLTVLRPVTVHAARRGDGHLLVEAGHGVWQATVVISATGTRWRPYIPHHPGLRDFGGEHLHTAGHRVPEPLRGMRVVIVGGGNSAAQLLAEASTLAEVTWVTSSPSHPCARPATAACSRPSPRPASATLIGAGPPGSWPPRSPPSCSALRAAPGNQTDL
ncbi:NAD(P)-binding domain-containing protein [Nonomuraea sp. B5E05]|uniref:NAD(P)-binding domain-containing protein n=1 Tax=Nonomuraea sp. B5E05 TaxID=3153569 RepID=UPI003260D778